MRMTNPFACRKLSPKQLRLFGILCVDQPIKTRILNKTLLLKTHSNSFYDTSSTLTISFFKFLPVRRLSYIFRFQYQPSCESNFHPNRFAWKCSYCSALSESYHNFYIKGRQGVGKIMKLGKADEKRVNIFFVFAHC